MTTTAPPSATLPTETSTGSGYDKPPQAILDVLHAPASPYPSISPSRKSILLVSNVEYPPIAQVAEPFLKLAGVRVEPRTRRKHDTPGGYGVAACAQAIQLVDVASTKAMPLALPVGGCVDGISWASDGAHFAFRNTAQDAVELWIGDLTGATHRIDRVRLNPMLGGSHQWMPDKRTLLVKLAPENQGPPPVASVVSDGPSIQETTGQQGQSSTYEARDTLNNKHDEALFDYYATSQLAMIDSVTGKITKVGAPAVLTDVSISPDGEDLLVESIRRPYSYLVTYQRFAHDVEIWDKKGVLLKSLAKLPVADRVPIAGVPTGPRSFDWRPTEPATLVWAEALDGGDWNAKVPARDKLMTQKAPWSGEPTELMRTEQRFGGFEWTEKPSTQLLVDYDDNKHWSRTFITDIDAKRKPVVLFDLSSDEHYKDPGNPLYTQLPNGHWAVKLEGDSIFLTGDGASPAGERPFLDKLDLETRKSTRLFRSDPKAYEYAVTLLDDGRFMTLHESPIDPPNLFARKLGAAVSGAPVGEATFASDAQAITHIPDPVPAVRAVKRRLVKYKRKDGVELSFTLLTPPGYVEGTRVPTILNAYPLDYAQAATAGQVTGSEQHFTELREYRLLLMAGYAIIDSASFPIVGDPKKAYDTYLEQLTADAQAAVDKAVSLGVVDPDRIGVTGHSHGALMTVNLLAHTKLFRAGAATSGSYNKTLTPFGFQNERRSVWAARDTYLKVSPFFMADKLKTPLLIVHGADDANPGTTPIQAVFLYEALRGNGGTARLVMLPHEPHWYSAMESNEQLLAEEVRWFDKYVKNAEPRGASSKKAVAAP
ncbi:MAG TPA: prolyl oligopeptidase family serine peptidase [Kofleriaceae bacterium]